MTKKELKELKDKAARVTISDDQVFIEIWTGEEWRTDYIYPIDSDNRVHYKALVTILQLAEYKFHFEPLLIG